MNSQSIGTLAHRSTGDVMTIQQILTPLLPEALTDAAQLFFMIIALFVLGPVYAIVVLVSAPLILFFVKRINLRVQHLAREAQQRSEGIMTHFIEGAAGYRDLVAAGRFDNAAKAFGGRLEGLKKVAVKTSVFGFSVGLFPFFAFTLLTFVYYFIKTSNPDAVGDMAYLGKMMSFAGLLMMVQGPAMSLTNFLTEKALAAPSFIEVHKLLEAEGVTDVEVGAKLSGRSIQVEGLSFSYSPGAPQIIEDANFEIEDGSFTAIVGQTGSGKTTLFYLLLRLLEAQRGAIKIGGVPLSDVRLIDLRNFLGFIPQAPFIFDATIRENLCMGVPEEYDDAEIDRAIQLAQLEGLVQKRTSTGGVEAPVGPGGSTLSGGERQRIALGRIFLRKPEIIVCDEYTANIDNATARLIQKSLAEVFAGKTRIVITHQLYTVRDADKIIVLDRGRVVGAGTHEELLAEEHGLYREMWEVQRLG
jgi:ABC-type multidrug transport system fused ATPase/permease subunit